MDKLLSSMTFLWLEEISRITRSIIVKSPFISTIRAFLPSLINFIDFTKSFNYICFVTTLVYVLKTFTYPFEQTSRCLSSFVRQIPKVPDLPICVGLKGKLKSFSELAFNFHVINPKLWTFSTEKYCLTLINQIFPLQSLIYAPRLSCVKVTEWMLLDKACRFLSVWCFFISKIPNNPFPYPIS